LLPNEYGLKWYAGLAGQLNAPRQEQGWHIGESACLPPMWPGLDSSPVPYMWVEFVIGSRLAPWVFLWILRFFFLMKNQHFQIPV